MPHFVTQESFVYKSNGTCSKAMSTNCAWLVALQYQKLQQPLFYQNEYHCLSPLPHASWPEGVASIRNFNNCYFIKMNTTVSLLCLMLAGLRGWFAYSWCNPNGCTTLKTYCHAFNINKHHFSHWVHHQEVQHQVCDARWKSEWPFWGPWKWVQHCSF